MASWIKKAIGAVLVAGAVGIGATAVISDHQKPVTGGTITCNQSTASASLASLNTAVTAASNGQTVCLAQSGDYGSWTGTNKSITIIPQVSTGTRNPTQASIFLDLNTGDGNFTINGNRTRWNDTVGTSTWTGLWVRGANFAGQASAPTNVTIKDSLFQGRASDGACADAAGNEQIGGCIEMDLDTAMTPRNVLIEHNVFTQIQDHDASVTPGGYTGTEAAIRWPDEGNSGWTVRNNLVLDITADGFKVGGNVTITNNLLIRVQPPTVNPFGEDIHADAIQLFSARGANVRGNWVDDCEQAISGFDGMGVTTLEHNLVTQCSAHHITIYGQDVAHGDYRFNTIASTVGAGIATHGRIECGNRPADPISIPSIYNNVARFIATTGAGGTCAATRNDHNLCDSACGSGTSQITGTPVFVGGSNPVTWDSIDDGCLATGSPGLTGADDGTQVGLCGGDWNAATDGPPEGEGYP